ncbi:phosphatase PAP2 family protein [Burkholderia anthina]|uniref:phosphatase PAP2 family protein n=1 Tax=Burkholderia anthina TaxID=179879 RepID=UPI00158C2DA7|nr:phosphatase PAP2 family protein [Burkholderia anthina]
MLDYLCVALARPSIENHLVRFDAMLGFHWLDVYRWMTAQAGLHRVLDLAYRSGMPQLFAVPFILAAARRVDDLGEFVAQFMFVSATLVWFKLQVREWKDTCWPTSTVRSRITRWPDTARARDRGSTA